MPNRGRARVRTVARRQPTIWSRVVSVGFTTIGVSTKTLFTTSILNNPGIGETVRRTRGAICVISDQFAEPEAQFGALGMVVVSDIAIVAGAASIPGPVTEAQDDGWYVWQPFLAGNASNGVNPDHKNPQQYFEWDSKAMRRIEEGFGVAVMIENASSIHAFRIGIQISC